MSEKTKREPETVGSDESREHEERELGTEEPDESPLAERDPDEEPGRGEVLARATIHLPGLGFNETAYVDPKIPYVKTCLEQGYLVEIKPDER